MTAILAPAIVFKDWDGNGQPLAFGTVGTYQAGTLVPQATYVDSTQTTPNTNPITLNNRGEANIWLNPLLNYKFIVLDSAGRQIRVVDNIQGSLTYSQLIAILTQTFIGSILYPRSAAEIAAGVTPVALWIYYGQRERYATLADAVAVSATYPLMIYAGETITAHITIPDGGKIYGLGRPQITNSTPGDHVFDATSKSEILVQGVRFKGASSSTAPSFSIGGFSANNTGLLTFAACTDVRVYSCEFDTFYNGLTFQGCNRVWAELANRVSTYQSTGILCTSTQAFTIDDNDISGCTQAGGVVAYGIQATGDEAGGNPDKVCSISRNRIKGIKSWAGIASHDIDGLRCIGNDIRDVRIGIDMGHLVSTNAVKNIDIADNYIEATTTDTWAGAAAAHEGIGSQGFDATHRVSGLRIHDNEIRGFFSMTGAPTYTSLSGNIVVAHLDDADIHDNAIINTNTTGAGIAQCSGVYATGTCNRLMIHDNSVEGRMTRGAIRIDAVTGDLVTIRNNEMQQNQVADNGVDISGSTFTASIGGNTGNSTTLYVEATSTITYKAASPRVQYTGTLTGCTTSPTNAITGSINDDVVTLEIPGVQAISNTTACTITGMPASLRPANQQTCQIKTFDNGSANGTISDILVETSGVLTLHNGTSATFTNVNSKGVGNGTITYRRVA